MHTCMQTGVCAYYLLTDIRDGDKCREIGQAEVRSPHSPASLHSD